MDIMSFCIDPFFAILSGEPVVADTHVSHAFARRSEPFPYVSEQDFISLKMSLRDQIYCLFMRKHVLKQGIQSFPPTLREVSNAFKLNKRLFACHRNHRQGE